MNKYLCTFWYDAYGLDDVDFSIEIKTSDDRTDALNVAEMLALKLGANLKSFQFIE